MDPAVVWYTGSVGESPSFTGSVLGDGSGIHFMDSSGGLAANVNWQHLDFSSKVVRSVALLNNVIVVKKLWIPPSNDQILAWVMLNIGFGVFGAIRCDLQTETCEVLGLRVNVVSDYYVDSSRSESMWVVLDGKMYQFDGSRCVRTEVMR